MPTASFTQPAAARVLRALALAAAAAATSACAPLAWINATAPADTYTGETGIAYGPGSRQKLDVYRPVSLSGPAPVAVFFYGGGWASGSRVDYLFVGEALASRGIVTVVADYRLYPEVRFPSFVEDAAQAVAWTARHIGAFGGDPNRIAVVGHSAGAYNAAMVALDGRYLRRAGVDPGVVQGFVGLAGPYDFLPLTSRRLREVFGYPDTPPETQPIRFASASAPASLILWAHEDGIVSPGNSERLAARLRAAGASVQAIPYEGVGHRTLVGAFAVPLRHLAPVLDDVAHFVTSLPPAEPARQSR